MASTRTNLTAAFVAGLIAVAGVLALTMWAVRNASLYSDVARNASTEADLAARPAGGATFHGGRAQAIPEFEPAATPRECGLPSSGLPQESPGVARWTALTCSTGSRLPSRGPR